MNDYCERCHVKNPGEVVRIGKHGPHHRIDDPWRLVMTLGMVTEGSNRLRDIIHGLGKDVAICLCPDCYAWLRRQFTTDELRGLDHPVGGQLAIAEHKDEFSVQN